MPAEGLDARVGELFERLSQLRAELGEEPCSRALHDLLQALGAAALREAERRALVLRDREPRPGDLRVVPFSRRAVPEPWDDVGD